MKKWFYLVLALCAFSGKSLHAGFCSDQFGWDVEAAVSGYTNDLYTVEIYIVQLEMAALRYNRCIAAQS